MPPRIPLPTRRRLVASLQQLYPHSQPSFLITRPSSTARCYATATDVLSLGLPDDYVPPTKPPSVRPPEARKSQMLRTYTSLLRSSPLILIFQHNNLTAIEWAAVRRELSAALDKVADPTAPDGTILPAGSVKEAISIQVIRTRIFNVALKLVEFFNPEEETTSVAGKKQSKGSELRQDKYTHDLSRAAYEAVKAAEASPVPGSMYEQIAPLLVGPTAIVAFPAVLPQHVAAILSVLAPTPGKFPAPTKRGRPGYHEPVVQSALHKLLLVGGRIEGQVFDLDQIKWLGGISGGLDGLRAQLVGLLQGAGLGLTSTLEGASKSLWLTVEGRRGMLEEQEKGPDEKLSEETKAE